MISSRFASYARARMAFCCKTSVAAALVFASVARLTANDIVNAGFETGTYSSWTTSGIPSITSAEAHTGTFSSANVSNDAVSLSFGAIDVTNITELSFWGKRSGGLFHSIVFGYSDLSTQNELVDTIGKGNDWTFVNLTSFLDTGKSLTSFQVFGTSPGPAYLDDFKLETTSRSVPDYGATAMMLAGGLTCLSIFRRRSRK
jgi:hypothetical protein